MLRWQSESSDGCLEGTGGTIINCVTLFSLNRAYTPEYGHSRTKELYLFIYLITGRKCEMFIKKTVTVFLLNVILWWVVVYSWPVPCPPQDISGLSNSEGLCLSDGANPGSGVFHSLCHQDRLCLCSHVAVVGRWRVRLHESWSVKSASIVPLPVPITCIPLWLPVVDQEARRCLSRAADVGWPALCPVLCWCWRRYSLGDSYSDNPHTDIGGSWADCSWRLLPDAEAYCPPHTRHQNSPLDSYICVDPLMPCVSLMVYLV